MATALSPDDKTQEDNNPGQDEFDKLVEKNFSPEDEKAVEESAKEGAEKDAGNESRASEAGEKNSDKSSSNEQAQITQHDDTLGSGYKKEGKKSKNSLQNLSKRRGLLAGGGLLAAGLITGIVLLLSFLNVFKLDDLMSNIDAKTFARLNGVADRRSERWMQSYLELRLMDIGDDPDLNKGANSDNLIFRSNNISTGNPISDWYRTLRTSSFEQDLLERNGIKFVSVAQPNGTGGYKVRAGKVDIAGEKSIPINVSSSDIAKIQAGNTVTLNKYRDYLDTQVFASDKAARREIKQDVHNNTRFFQVIERRQLRKDIQNMTGVRDWRFFEKTRDKVDDKKIDIRNKLVTKAIPESTLSGKFVRCLFGITSCRFSEDPSDPQYQSESSLAGENNPDNPDDPVNQQGDDGKPVPNPDSFNLGPAADILKQIISKANVALGAVNIVQTLDSLSHVDQALNNGQLSKGVAVARGVQTMGIYQVFKTSRDQMKTGQLTSEEVNKFMQVIGPVSHGEGWTKVISGKGDPSKLTNTTKSREYCSQKNQAAIDKNPALGNKQFAYLCPDKQIGGSSNAAALEDSYNSSIGSVLHPILNSYNGVRHAPFIGTLVDIANSIVGSIQNVVAGLVKDIFAAIGIEDNIENAMQWIIGKMTAFLGAGPILSGNEAAPVFMNWLVQGGAYTAEASARASGAALTTSATKVTAVQTAAQYQSEKLAQMSVFDRYLSTSNPDSLVSEQAFALSEQSMSSLTGKLTNFSLIFRTIGNAVTQPFTKHSSAASNKGYEGTDFSGIQTFDFPSACNKRDPVAQTPLDGTNIQDVLGKDKAPDSEITWDLVNSRDLWYQYIYDKIGNDKDADKTAEKIYNCNLLDTRVRGGIGYVYGYTDDDGLEDNAAADNSSSADSSTGSETLPTGSSQDLAEQLVKYLDNGAIGCNGGQGSRCPDIRSTASGQSIKNSSCYVDKLDSTLLGMLLKLAEMGHKFVLSAICSDHPSNPASYHHKGKAVDFNSIDGVFMGPNDSAWNSSKIAAGKKLDQDIASFMPKSTGFGQETGRCHPHFDFLSGFSLFDDACHHQHVQAP
jgi:hypothetical protein